MSEEFTRGFPAVVVRYTKTRLKVVKGPDTGLTLDIADRSVRLGTSPDNDMVLSDDAVSRCHCELEPTSMGIRVRDIGSTNGVFAGGARFYDAVLMPPASLSIGDTTLSITPLGETVERTQATVDRFGDLLGRSPRMRELFADLERIAPTEATLLIEGETGTGKDVVAESVHRASPRAERPYVVFDCSAVAPSLVESELFGHERGAFTGALGTRQGVFEQADTGTLFLDELGELPKDLQPKLLRVLEKRELRRVGGTKTIDIDVRVIAATNRSLLSEIRRGGFREDLYYRLSTAHVTVPPLRDRMVDVPMLVEHFLSLERPPRSADAIRPEVWAMLQAHRWPGNVRELRNTVQRLLLMPERAISAIKSAKDPQEAPPPNLGDLVPLRIARRDAIDDFELRYLRAILDRTGGNITRAASIAEVSRQMIQKLMRKHGLRDDS